MPAPTPPLHTRAGLADALRRLLAPLPARRAPGGYDLGAAHAHYAPRVALMEGWSRTLWGVGPLMAGRGPGATPRDALPAIDDTLAILREGVNPASPGYWGVPGDRDQRHVEMASIALAIAIAPDVFWEPLDGRDRERLYAWLRTIEDRQLPANNWHFFRVLVCEAFHRLGLPVNEAAERESLDLIETLYRGDGWYQDGADGLYDGYNPFGFHYYGLVYAHLAGGRDPERAARYIERARRFAAHYVHWFQDDGAVIPYGRSLSYRFAAGSFFAACAFAGIDALPWPVMKGIVTRHLRWWFARPILDAAGLLTVGYGYPNLVMADRYNSPGSPYWGLKAFLTLALDDNHPFWRADEAPAPLLPAVAADPVPGFVYCRAPARADGDPAAAAGGKADGKADSDPAAAAGGKADGKADSDPDGATGGKADGDPAHGAAHGDPAAAGGKADGKADGDPAHGAAHGDPAAAGGKADGDPAHGDPIADDPADDHVYLLAPGQRSNFEMIHSAEKYGKFAYSARFGFCVSQAGYHLETIGADSTLLLRDAADDEAGGGDANNSPLGYWRQRREVPRRVSGPAWTASQWNPWPDVAITTVLVGLGAWHVRVHRVDSRRALDAVEGGFAIPRYHAHDPALPAALLPAPPGDAHVAFPWAASRVIALEKTSAQRRAALLIPAPNLNIVFGASVIPVITGRLTPGVTLLVTAARAGGRADGEPPRVEFVEEGLRVTGAGGEPVLVPPPWPTAFAA